MASLRELEIQQAESNNRVGTIESILAGVGPGLLATPRSNNVAPNEKKPFGIARRPEPTPASIDSIVPTLLFDSACCISSSLRLAMSYS